MQTPPLRPIDAGTERLIEERLEARPRAPPRARAGRRGRVRAASRSPRLIALRGARRRRRAPFSLPLALAFVVAVRRSSHRVEFTRRRRLHRPDAARVRPDAAAAADAVRPAARRCSRRRRGRRLDRRAAAAPPQRMLLAVNDAAFALAPAAVLVALGAQTPDWSHWPAYVAALAAQFAADAARETRPRLARRRRARRASCSPRSRRRIGSTSLLAPIGLLAAIAAADAPAAALLVLPLVALLAVFAREREARDRPDDRARPRLPRHRAAAARPARGGRRVHRPPHRGRRRPRPCASPTRWASSEDVRRETELGALLHDIGKIHIPDSIINKPGTLDDEEWAIMKTHTIEGQRMLDRVGGLLGTVGVVVRASHERFDGTRLPGRPGRRARSRSPRGSSAACDAFNAMTTDPLLPRGDADRRPPSTSCTAARAPSSTRTWSRRCSPSSAIRAGS